jgi:hypothetical protein
MYKYICIERIRDIISTGIERDREIDTQDMKF